jgi:hypothetical protein
MWRQNDNMRPGTHTKTTHHKTVDHTLMMKMAINMTINLYPKYIEDVSRDVPVWLQQSSLASQLSALEWNVENRGQTDNARLQSISLACDLLMRIMTYGEFYFVAIDSSWRETNAISIHNRFWKNISRNFSEEIPVSELNEIPLILDNKIKYFATALFKINQLVEILARLKGREFCILYSSSKLNQDFFEKFIDSYGYTNQFSFCDMIFQYCIEKNSVAVLSFGGFDDKEICSLAVSDRITMQDLQTVILTT